MSTRGTSKAAEKVSFARPPFWRELDDLKEKFNDLPPAARHFIKRLIQSDGDFYKSAKDSGMLDKVTKTMTLALPEETNITKALRVNGINQGMMFSRLKEIIVGKEEKLNGKGDVVEVDNMNASIKGISMAVKLMEGEDLNDKGNTIGDAAEELFKNTDV